MHQHNTHTHTNILTCIMYCICWLFKSLLMYWTYCIWWQSFDTCQSTFAFIFGFHLNRFDLTWFVLIALAFQLDFHRFGCSLNAFSIYAFSLASAVVIVVLVRFSYSNIQFSFCRDVFFLVSFQYYSGFHQIISEIYFPPTIATIAYSWIWIEF